MPDTIPPPQIDRRAIWKRLMDRAQAAQRTPTAIEPAGYQFTPEVIEALPAEAQTELALQLGKLVLDNSQLKKAKRILPSPVPINLERARAGFHRAASVGRSHSRQGVTFMLAIREGALSIPVTPEGHTKVMSPTGPIDLPHNEVALLPCCSVCDVTVSDPAMLSLVENRMVCGVCRSLDERECPSCHGTVLWYGMQTGPTGPVCHACAERLMTRCPSCASPVARGAVRGGRCPECEVQNFIQCYSHKPAPKFFIYPDLAAGNAPALMPRIWCMGVELETELPRSADRSRVAHAVCRGIDDFIYAKSDGSLTHGVEYVSHPFSWEWLKGAGGHRWSEFLHKLRTSGHSSYDPGTCGMHVHVTKAPFLNGALSRLLYLAHNSPQMFLAISRRKEADLMQWANPRGGEPHLFTNLDMGLSHSHSKYTAINVTSKTIEFRLFRGTLDETAFMGNLEAVHAMLTYCQRVDAPARPSTNDFMLWMNKPEVTATYPNMVAKLLRSTSKV